MGIKELTEGYLTYGKCYRCAKKLTKAWYIIEIDNVPLEFCFNCGYIIGSKCQRSQ